MFHSPVGFQSPVIMAAGKQSFLKLEYRDLVQLGNMLKLKCVLKNCTTTTTQHVVYTTPEFVINGAAIFQVRVNSITPFNAKTNTPLLVKFHKKNPDEDDFIYTLRLTCTCNEYSIVNKRFLSDDDTWHLIHENSMYRENESETIEIIVFMDVIPKMLSFTRLWEEEVSTDFEMRSDDGFVRVHKAILSAASPVLHQMISAACKESTDHIKIPGATKITLQNLKGFLYTRTLPFTEIEQLLVLAAYYSIPVLEQKCVNVLINDLTGQNAWDLLEFAVKNQATRLTLAILHSVQNCEIQMTDIRKTALQGKPESMNIKGMIKDLDDDDDDDL